MGEKLQKATFKHIEAELYQYPNTVKEIKKRRMELLHPYLEEVDENQGQGMNSVRSISRPTEQMATRLTMDKRLRNLEEIVEAIESVYNDLEDKQKEFVRLRYWSGRQNSSPVKIAMVTDVSERTVHNYRRKIVEAVGKRIGWM
ncbi:transcriptional regulator [Bacillus sp. C1-1]|nr:transcriptional regulator [Bacillus sp. C1-1]